MADFAGYILGAPTLLLGVGDAVDFAGYIMPFTAIQDLVAPVASAVTVISYPVERTDPLVLRVVDLIVLKQLIANVKYASGEWEAAYDGENFSPKYLTAATGPSTLVKTSSTDWTITLRRAGGWPFAPIANIRAIDGAGNMS